MASATQVPTIAPESLKDRLKQALSQARQVCGLGAESSADCQTAWETVAELGIAAEAQDQEQQEQPFFTAYCEEHPGAVECKVYDT